MKITPLLVAGLALACSSSEKALSGLCPRPRARYTRRVRVALSRLGESAKALVGRPLFWLVALAILFGWPIARTLRLEPAPPPGVLGEVPSFTLVNERGDLVTRDMLKGHVWAASFAGATCGAPCEAAAVHFYKIQHRARGLGEAFKLVTFAADPARDTPPAMAAFARQARASPRMWTFLSGPPEQITPFKETVRAIQPGEGPGFALIDGDLRIRGVYPADEAGRGALLRAAGRLAYGR